MPDTPNFTPPTRTLGPVSDLERHLPSDWWRSRFNAVYLKSDGDVVENDVNTQTDVDRLLAALDLGPEDPILDLCCGQGRHCLELARRGFRAVTGIDRSRYLVRLARRRAKARGLAVRFREGDARKFMAHEDAFAAVLIMGNSFGYFDREDEDLDVLKAVRRALRADGRVAIDLTNGDWMRAHFEPRSWEWIDGDHFVCRERSLSADGGRLISREVVVHAEKGVIADQFYAERLYSRERLSALMKAAGFTGIHFADELAAQSDRGTDLGMMARRDLITARAAVPRVQPTAPSRPPFPDVTVILGDPRLPDQVKRGGVFNAEDMDTVNRLKSALDGLDGYRFTYLDDHARLFDTLRRDRPAFVLNLCDEGLSNIATRELHVPAMLEMLDIPYSGAGPGALGLCYDKALVRAIAADADIPVPLETSFGAGDHAATLPSVFPALIKPCTGDSSLGITQNAVVHDTAAALAYLEQLRRDLPGRAILIQEFLTGAEYSIGMIGNPGGELFALPALEVDYSRLDASLPRILGYESKWHPDSPYWTDIAYREARLDDAQRQSMIDWASLLFQRLGCRDYARFDFRADATGAVKLLEVNPNPGWCWDGKLNLMAEFGGMDYAALLRAILEAAQVRVAGPAELAAAAAGVAA
ncbi:MAG: methyltransferase domain-containing protein [Rhodospirillaceae bacterium]